MMEIILHTVQWQHIFCLLSQVLKRTRTHVQFMIFFADALRKENDVAT